MKHLTWKAALLLVAGTDTTAFAQESFTNPQEFKTFYVRVYDTSTGLGLPGVPVMLDGMARATTTDDYGTVVIGFSGTPEPSQETVWTSPEGYSLGIADIVVDEAEESIELGVAPNPMQITPLITASEGGEFILAGPVTQAITPSPMAYLKISVPAYSLPEDGRIAASFSPSWSVRPSGRFAFQPSVDFSVPIAKFSLQFVGSDGNLVDLPSLGSPITITLNSWCYPSELIEWDQMQGDWFQLLHLNESSLEYELHSSAASMLYPDQELLSFDLDHFSSWMVRSSSVDPNLLPPALDPQTQEDSWADANSTSWGEILSNLQGYFPKVNVFYNPYSPSLSDIIGNVSQGAGAVKDWLIDVKTTDYCDTKMSVGLGCGLYSENASYTCENGHGVTIGADIVAEIEESLGLGTGALFGGLVQATAQHGRSIGIGANGAITISGAQSISRGVSGGQAVHGSNTASCLSGWAHIKAHTQTFTLVVAGNQAELPGVHCKNVGIVHDYSIDTQCHYPNPANTTQLLDCHEGVGAPKVKNTIKCP
jgi:hypothetical protein